MMLPRVVEPVFGVKERLKFAEEILRQAEKATLV